MAVRLKFHGAARTVTGSCYMIDTGSARVLVDCGMFQGSRSETELNYRPFPFEPKAVDALVLTHAHIDHTGLVPKLVKHGFAGAIHATPATADLCSIMLPDSGFIQEMEVRQLNERRKRRGLAEVEPIYTAEDARAALAKFKGVSYETWFSPAAGIRMRYWNAGHLLGSASIETEVEAGGEKPVRILFSGDIGPDNKMLEHDPEAPTGFDFVVCESTYGGRDRFERSEEGRRAILAKVVNDAAVRRGALLVPSFAVERTQEIVTDLVVMMEKKQIPQASIFIDSPLASKATAIFARRAAELQHGGDLARAFASPLVKSTESVEDSKALARFTGFRIIIAASGMCEAGRIRHHLQRWLWNNRATVLLVGYQAQGTLGRFLHDGAEAVRIQGEEIRVAARIRMLDEYSGHADGAEVARWIAARRPIERGLFLVHGEEPAIAGLAGRVAERIIPAARIYQPLLDDAYELAAPEPRLLDGERRRRLAPEAVTHLDWHNDMSRLILDINDEVRSAADDRARGVIIRRLRRALENAG